MTRREWLGATENEISTRNACIAHAPPQQGDMNAAAAERRIGCRVRQITDAVKDIKSRGGGRSPVHPRKIERPSGLLQPGPHITLELGVIILGEAPTSDIR